MKKLHLKARFNGENISSSLIRAFFHDFKSRSSIDIKDGKVQMKVICDDVPEEIIEAITYFCEVDEFHYGESFDDCTDDATQELEESETEDATSDEPEDVPVEDDTSGELEEVTVEVVVSDEPEEVPIEDATSDETEDVPVEVVVSDEPEEVSTEDATSEEPEETPTEVSENRHDKAKISDIPELEELAKKSNSFGDFTYLVAKWLDQGTRCNIFVYLAYAATKVDKVSWNSLSDLVRLDDRIIITESHKNMMAMKASKKLKKYSLTMLPLLRIVAKYKDYPFGDKKTDEATNEDKASDVYEKSEELSETDSPKVKVKMDCMPEIPDLEEVLGCMDKTQPIEYRVGKVLSSMTGDNGIQHEVYVIANTAVRLKDINFDSVKLSAGLSENLQVAWMTLSKFINGFAARYGSSQKIKVLDFLKDLQKVILSESEIANL